MSGLWWSRLREHTLARLLALRHRSALDLFVRSAQAPQNAVDLFKGDWISSFPPEAGVTAGDRPLYDDPRLRWMLEQVPATGRRVVELGPLEGSHTYQLLRAGAASVTALESNGKSFLKCLVTKEVLRLDRARYLCADFMEWLTATPEHFDLCLASGVLYHMTEPLKMIGLACARADVVFLWTHYYDESVLSRNPDQAHRFGPATELEWNGFRARGHHRSYGAQAWNPLHLGGKAAFSYWMTKDDIVAAFRHFGHTDITLGPEDLTHPAGPALCLVAKKK